MRLHRFVSAGIFLLAASVPAAALDLSSKEIADRVSGELREQIPSYTVTESDSATLQIFRGNTQLFQVNIAEIQKFCAANSDDCDAAISSFVTKVAGLVKAGNGGTPALTTAMLRDIVRQASYADELNVGSPGAASDPLVTRQLGPHMIALCVFDLSGSLRPARMSDVKALGLSADQALNLCDTNTQAHLPELEDQVQQLGAHSFSMLQGDSYTASQFAFPANWKPINKEMADKLIVVVVGTNLIVYGREDSPDDVAAMKSFAAHLTVNAGHPISSDVYRWTKTGWQIAQE